MRAVALKRWKLVGTLWMVWEKGARGDKADVIGGGWTERKERVWKMRISLRLTRKQDELVEEAEGQGGAVTYTEEASAKTNMDDGAKEGWCLSPWPWAWVTLGAHVWLSVSQHTGSAPA